MSIEIRDYTNSELVALPPLVIDPGTTDANGITRGRHLRNPFEGANEALARRWSEIHFAGDSDDGPAIESDPFDALRAALDTQKLWHEQRDADGSLVAVHPLVSNFQAGSEAQRKLEVEWEARSIAMHESQRTITLDAKPSDTTYRATRLVSDLDGHSEPAKFEDSDESRRLRGLQRGD